MTATTMERLKASSTAVESAPLLSPDHPDNVLDVVSIDDASRCRDTPSRNSNALPTSHSWQYAAMVAGALSLLVDLEAGLVAAPEVRLLEMAVCRDYYRVRDPGLIGPPPLSYVKEEWCKVDGIQVELAYLRALKGLFGAIPGLMCTMLFGRLADVWGRKPVLLLGITGQTLSYLWVILVCYLHESLPTRLVWASAAFQFLGGGNRVLLSLVNTVIVDVAPKEKRTTTFYLIGAAVFLVDIIASLAGAVLLSRDLWLPYKFGTPILLLAFPLAFALPETLPQPASTDAPETHPLVAPSPSPKTTTSTTTTTSSPSTLFRTALTSTITTLTSSLDFSYLNRNVAICFSIVFLKTFALMSHALVLQFASKAMRWTIAQAGYLLIVKAAVSLCVLLFLPAITRLLERRCGFTHKAVDTWVARWSLVLLAMGSCIVGGSRGGGMLVFGLTIASSGKGITHVMRGLVANFASESNTGELYAGLALTEMAAILTGNMAFAGLFDVGTRLARRSGEGWLGLPFWGAAVVFGAGVGCAMRLPKEGSRGVGRS